MNNAQICEDGYIILDFNNAECINQIQDEVKSMFGMNPVEFHAQKIIDNERLHFVKEAKDLIVKKSLVKNLLQANTDVFETLLGPDIDVQSDIYLRVSRPNQESDFIDWHRDTFYGNSHWELNLWFPVFPLEEGAGLVIADGSHLLPASNIRPLEEQNPFRKQVVKGSIANELGYLYAPKCDDTMLEIDPSKIKLLAPKVGQFVLFFAHCLHRAQNLSSKTRISIDVRIKHMLAPTNTKPGYYQSLTRSSIARYVEKIQFMEQGVSCGN